jgi:alanyl aminopeptidase
MRPLFGLLFVVVVVCESAGAQATSSPPQKARVSPSIVAPALGRAPGGVGAADRAADRAAVTQTGPDGGRLPRDVTPVAQQISLELDPRKDSYAGVVVIDVTLQAPRRTIWLHARDLAVDHAAVTVGAETHEARFSIVIDDDGIARVDVDTPLPPGPAQLTLAFRGGVRRDLEGLYGVRAPGKDGVVDDYLFSQFEALAAREAFPCFDEPAWKIPFSVQVTHPAADDAIANTQRVARDVLPDGRVRDRFATTAPLPTYLLAFVVGPVDVVDGGTLPPTTLRALPLPLRAIAVRGRGKETKQALANVARVVALQEQLFQIGYPYDKLDVVAVPDFSAGAMENAGLVTFRDSLLFVDDTSPIAAQKGSLETIAHELAHQWFGNLVTMAWWDDLWLNEAFASWFEARTVQLLRPDFDTALGLREGASWVMGEDSLTSARQIREPIKNRGDIENAFDGITYTKGAAVIAMFEEYIDHQTKPGTFLSGVTRYLNDHRFGSGTTADFLTAISAAAGFDIQPAFSTFLDQPGVPLVHATCTAANGFGTSAIVTFRSERFLPVGSTGEKNKRWDIPACVSFFVQGQRTKRCTILLEGRGSLDLGQAECPRVWHPNADGAGYYRFSLPPDALKALAGGLSRATPGERLSFAQAVRGGFEAATTPFGDVLAASRSLALDDEVSVAVAPLGLLQFARDDVLIDAAARARVDVEIQRLYQPALNRLGLVDRRKDTAKDRERRQSLFHIVVDARGAARTIAVVAGRELWETATTKRVAKELWPTALAAAVEDGPRGRPLDAATWDAWLTRAKRQANPLLRRHMLQALSSTRDPGLVDRALSLVFDDALGVAERTTGIFALAGDHKTREQAYRFVTTRWDDVQKRVPEGWRPGLAEAFEGFCAEEDAARVEGFFLPKVPTTPGLDRALAQSVEDIRLCAAKKAAHQQAIRTLFLDKTPPAASTTSTAPSPG